MNYFADVGMPGETLICSGLSFTTKEDEAAVDSALSTISSRALSSSSIMKAWPALRESPAVLLYCAQPVPLGGAGRRRAHAVCRALRGQLINACIAPAEQASLPRLLPR